MLVYRRFQPLVAPGADHFIHREAGKTLRASFDPTQKSFVGLYRFRSYDLFFVMVRPNDLL